MLEVKTKALFNALHNLSLICETSELAAYNCIKIEAVQEQVLIYGISTSSKAITAIPLESVVSLEPTTILIPLNRVLDITKASNKDTVKFTEKEGKVIVSSGRSRMTLPSMQEGSFPPVKIPDSPEKSKIQKDYFIRLVADLQTSNIRAKSLTANTREWFNALHINKDHLVCSNSSVLGKADNKILPMGDNTLLLSPHHLSKLPKFHMEAEELTVWFTEKEFIVDMGGTVVSFTIIYGEYPPYRKVLEDSDGVGIEVNPAEMRATLDRATLCHDKVITRAVSIKIGDGEVICFSNDNSGSSSEDVIPADTKDLKLPTLVYDADFLTSILSRCRGETVTMKFREDSRPLVIEDKERTFYVSQVRF